MPRWQTARLQRPSSDKELANPSQSIIFDRASISSISVRSQGKAPVELLRDSHIFPLSPPSSISRVRFHRTKYLPGRRPYTLLFRRHHYHLGIGILTTDHSSQINPSKQLRLLPPVLISFHHRVISTQATLFVLLIFPSTNPTVLFFLLLSWSIF